MKKVIMSLMLTTLLSVVSASAQTVIVTPANATALGWFTADTRPGGTVAITGAQPFAGNGSLNLTTNATNTAKAQFMHGANVPLASVTELSYSTYQLSGPPEANASYQLPVCLGGFNSPVTVLNPSGCTGFTTLVFEPYQQNGTAPPTQAIIAGVWQFWDADQGKFWSSRTYSDGANCSVSAGFGGAPFYDLSTLSSGCPNAVAVGFGVNIGTFNPSYDVFADLVNFNGTTYNFELFQAATSKDQCKQGGWMTVTRADSSPFRNQGDCIQYVNTGN